MLERNSNCNCEVVTRTEGRETLSLSLSLSERGVERPFVPLWYWRRHRNFQANATLGRKFSEGGLENAGWPLCSFAHTGYFDSPSELEDACRPKEKVISIYEANKPEL